MTLVIVIDNKGLYTQVDLNKLDKRHTIYIVYLIRLIRRTQELLFLLGMHGGHKLAAALTKLKPDKMTDEALAEVLRNNLIKIAYGTESFRKALKKGRTKLEKLTPWEPPSDDAVDFDEHPKDIFLNQ